eukprot:c22576_g1_i2 orf=700-924(-)
MKLLNNSLKLLQVLFPHQQNQRQKIMMEKGWRTMLKKNLNNSDSGCAHSQGDENIYLFSTDFTELILTCVLRNL